MENTEDVRIRDSIPIKRDPLIMLERKDWLSMTTWKVCLPIGLLTVFCTSGKN